jgi:hypothetical protein
MLLASSKSLQECAERENIYFLTFLPSKLHYPEFVFLFSEQAIHVDNSLNHSSQSCQGGHSSYAETTQQLKRRGRDFKQKKQHFSPSWELWSNLNLFFLQAASSQAGDNPDRRLLRYDAV